MKTQYYYVYILTNKTSSVLYTRCTSNLGQRIDQHKRSLVDGFTKRYKVNTLVYFEIAETLDSALYREKQIKGYSRKKKLALIDIKNPGWKDLFEEIRDL